MTFKDGLRGFDVIIVLSLSPFFIASHGRFWHCVFQVSVRYIPITLPSRHSRKVDGLARRSWKSSRGNSVPIQPRNTRGVFAPAPSRSTIKRWTSITGYGTTISWLTSSTGMRTVPPEAAGRAVLRRAIHLRERLSRRRHRRRHKSLSSRLLAENVKRLL